MSQAAVDALDKQVGAGLRVVPRWSFIGPIRSRDGTHMLLPTDHELLVLNDRTGQLMTRVPRMDAADFGWVDKDFEGEVNDAAGTVLLHAHQAGCELGVSVFDARSGALRKTYFASDWHFSGDGSRLALEQIDAWDSKVGIQRSVLIVDARSLAPLQTVAEPGVPGPHEGANFYAMGFAPDGVTLVVLWERGVSLTDLRSGKTRTSLFPGGARKWIPNSVGQRRMAWRFQDRVSVWNYGDEKPRTLPVSCAGGSGLALSDDDSRVAVVCTRSVGIWDAASLKPIESIPTEHETSDPRWLAGGRALLVGGPPDAMITSAVYDTVTRRLVPIEKPGERIQAVGTASRLITVAPVESGQQSEGRPRLVFLDADLVPHEVSPAVCTLHSYDIVEGGSGTAVVTCADPHGTRVLSFDPKTQRVRSFLANGTTFAIDGDELIGMGTSSLELRALDTGALLPGSPAYPTELHGDSWWEGATLVATMASGGRRVSHFGATLSAATEPITSASDCVGPDWGESDRFRWERDPPYVVCDRHTGRALSQLDPEKLFGTDAFEGTSNLELAPGGELLLTDYQNPRLLNRSSGREIPFRDPPKDAHFVAASLIAGSDQDGLFGVWNADGERVARWPKDKTPGYDPQTGYHMGTDDRAVAGDARSGVLVFGPRFGMAAPTLRDLQTGATLETLPAIAEADVRFVARGVLSVTEPGGVSFWRVPRARRLGIWLTHPRTGEAAFVADSGEFEVSGDLAAWGDVLRCERGGVEQPFETCARALLKPGLAAIAVGFEAAAPPR